MAPQGEDWATAVAGWKTLKTDPGACHDAQVDIDASLIMPSVTYGTHPGMVVAIDEALPEGAGDNSITDALGYMGFKPGSSLGDETVDVVFIGSCTNSRLSDLRAAAGIMRNRKIAQGLRMLVVPGSEETKRAAEAEGLDEIFKTAGAEWREPGCSMCIGMNGDIAQPGELVVSTSNRNFKGRQGKNSRTILASPLTAAACAVTGKVSSPMQFLEADND